MKLTIGPDLITLAAREHRGRPYHRNRYNCSVLLAALVIRAWPALEPHKEDLQLEDHDHLWSSVVAVSDWLPGGEEVGHPVPGRWHVVQGWRVLGQSGHALLWYALTPTTGIALEAQPGLGASASWSPLEECLDDEGRLTARVLSWADRVSEYKHGAGVRLAVLPEAEVPYLDLVDEVDSEDGTVELVVDDTDDDMETIALDDADDDPDAVVDIDDEDIAGEVASLRAERAEAHRVIDELSGALERAKALVARQVASGDERNRRRAARRARRGTKRVRRTRRDRRGVVRREVTRETAVDVWSVLDLVEVGEVRSIADVEGLVQRLHPALRELVRSGLDEDAILERVVPWLDERIRWDRLGLPVWLSASLEQQDGRAIEAALRVALRAVRAAL